MTIADISGMLNEQLLELLDTVVKKGNVKGKMDDDTVLYQQIRIEISNRMVDGKMGVND